MKRSQVADEIKDLLVINTGCSRTFADALAYDILNTLEKKIGMLPPARNADLKSEYGYARIYEWEKE
jgi:hypothetical protein